jgi:hypothetical protein
MEQLVESWKGWDEQPSSRHAVLILQNNIKRLADQLGCTPLEFRDQVNNNRNKGDTLEAAIEKAIYGFRE